MPFFIKVLTGAVCSCGRKFESFDDVYAHLAENPTHHIYDLVYTSVPSVTAMFVFLFLTVLLTLFIAKFLFSSNSGNKQNGPVTAGPSSGAAQVRSTYGMTGESTYAGLAQTDVKAQGADQCPDIRDQLRQAKADLVNGNRGGFRGAVRQLSDSVVNAKDVFLIRAIYEEMRGGNGKEYMAMARAADVDYGIINENDTDPVEVTVICGWRYKKWVGWIFTLDGTDIDTFIPPSDDREPFLQIRTFHIGRGRHTLGFRQNITGLSQDREPFDLVVSDMCTIIHYDEREGDVITYHAVKVSNVSIRTKKEISSINVDGTEYPVFSRGNGYCAIIPEGRHTVDLGQGGKEVLIEDGTVLN